MGALTSVLAASNAINAASSISTAFTQSQALRSRAGYQNAMDQANARLSGISADDALARGETAARLSQTRVRGVIGAQRSSFAAQGVDVNKGSAADVQSGTAAVGALDATTIRNNAMREALGYRMQAANYAARGRFAQLEGNIEARNTLITGGMNALGYAAKGAYWYGQGRSGENSFRVPDDDPSMA